MLTRIIEPFYKIRHLFRILTDKHTVYYSMLPDKCPKSWGPRLIYVVVLDNADDIWFSDMYIKDGWICKPAYDFERYKTYPNMSLQRILLRLGIFESHSELKGAGLDKIKLNFGDNDFVFKSKFTRLKIFKID